MLNLFQTIGKSVRGLDSSRQLALGLALGMLIGILPKDNLLVVGLLVVLIMSGANLVTGAVSGFIVSAISPALSLLFHRIGETVLSHELVLVPLGKFFQLPMASWTRLDNTTVAGSFVVGLAIILPVYIASFYFIEKHRESIKRLLTDSQLINWIVGYSPANTTEN